jgi:hypothetical protein
MTVPTGLTVSGNPITTSGTLDVTLTSGYSIPTTASQSNWDAAFTNALRWDGGATGLTASTGRTSLGATTLGSNLFTLANVAAIAFPRINADNTVSTLDAATFRTAIGAGTSSTTGTVTSVGGTGTVSGLTLTGTVTSSGNLTLGGTLSTPVSTINDSTTLGQNLVKLTNVTAIAFPRINADNTVSTLDAATFRTAIGAGTSSTTGTVTSVGGTGTVSGLTLTGTVTSSGNLTLGGTLSVTASNFASQTANTVLAAPNGAAGTPTFRALVAADIPTLNQNTTGTAATITGVYSGTITSSQVTTGLGFTPYNATNPSSYIALSSAITGYTAGTNTALAATDTLLAALGKLQGQITATPGTVTSVGGTGTVSGLTLTGTVTSSGNLTLGGTLSVTASNFASQTANTVLVAPNGSAGTPTFRTLVAADLPTITVAKGGTGLTAIAARSILVANTADTYTALTPAAGQSIRVNAGNTAWEVYTPSTGGAETDTLATVTARGATTSTATTFGTITISKTTTNTVGSSTTDQFQIQNAGTGGAIMSFHRTSVYAINLGLDTDNVFRLGGWSNGTNIYRWQSDTSGNFTAQSNVTAYSDERLKKDWKNLPNDFISKLSLVKNGTYTRIDNACVQVGVSAQSLQQILPEAVITDSNGILSVSYGNAALVSAVELAKEVVELRARLAKLEALLLKD